MDCENPDCEEAILESTASWANLWQAFRSGEAILPLTIGCGLHVLAQASGINVTSSWFGYFLPCAKYLNLTCLFVSIPFCPIHVVLFFWDGTSVEVIIYYGPKMFTLAGFPSSTAIFLSAGISACQMISTLLLSRLVDKVGRKPMSSSQLTDGCPLGPWRLT